MRPHEATTGKYQAATQIADSLIIGFNYKIKRQGFTPSRPLTTSGRLLSLSISERMDFIGSRCSLAPLWQGPLIWNYDQSTGWRHFRSVGHFGGDQQQQQQRKNTTVNLEAR